MQQTLEPLGTYVQLGGNLLWALSLHPLLEDKLLALGHTGDIRQNLRFCIRAGYIQNGPPQLLGVPIQLVFLFAKGKVDIAHNMGGVFNAPPL